MTVALEGEVRADFVQNYVNTSAKTGFCGLLSPKSGFSVN